MQLLKGLKYRQQYQVLSFQRVGGGEFRVLAAIWLVLAPILALANPGPGPISNNPLNWAVFRDAPAAINKIIIGNPGLLNSVDSDSRTALMYAAGNGADSALKILIKLGAHLNHQSREGVTALNWALEFHHFRAVKMLLHYGANPEIARRDSGNQIWPSGRNFGAHRYSVLECALISKNSDRYVFALLQAGANVNYVDPASRATPLFLACYYNFGSQVIQSLLDHGAKVNARNREGNTALTACFLNGNSTNAELLLTHGADISTRGYKNDLWMGNSEMNDVDWAITGGNTRCLELALAYGSDPRLKDGNGRDALAVARFAPKKGESPRNIEIIDAALYNLSSGWTPAHFVAEFDVPKAIPYLKNRHESLDHSDRSGMSPLMVATNYGNRDLVRSLLKFGASPMSENWYGKTALDFAIAKDNFGIGQMLVHKMESFIKSPKSTMNQKATARLELIASEQNARKSGEMDFVKLIGEALKS